MTSLARKSRLKVLVLERSRFLGRTLSKMLIQEGHDCTVKDAPVEAFSGTELQHFGLVVVDSKILKDEEARALARFLDVPDSPPVLLILEDNAHALQFRPHERQFKLVRPFERAALVSKLEKILGPQGHAPTRREQALYEQGSQMAALEQKYPGITKGSWSSEDDKTWRKK